MPWRKKTFTLHQTFCLRIVLKYRIEVSKALDLFTFISVNFGFYILRKIRVVVVVDDDDDSVQSPGEGGGGWGERRKHDFRFNPAIKYTLQTLTFLNFFL